MFPLQVGTYTKSTWVCSNGCLCRDNIHGGCGGVVGVVDDDDNNLLIQYTYLIFAL